MFELLIAIVLPRQGHFNEYSQDMFMCKSNNK